MSNSNNAEPRARINPAPRPLDAATFEDGTIVIRKNVATNGEFKIVVKVKEGTVFNVRVTD